MEIIQSIHDLFNGENATLVWLVHTLIILVIGYLGLPLILWTAWIAITLSALAVSSTVWWIFAVAAVIGNIPFLRAQIVSRPIMMVMKLIFPRISETERTALEAGVVWIEKDLFSGRPDFKKMLQEPLGKVTAEEQKFLDNQVATLCEMIDEYDIWKRRRIPDDVMNYIKKEKFLGMIIPKKYGGLGFSNTGHADVVEKITSRSVPVAITVMVPNSLGPAELLIHYGTQKQKDYWLPRLANGQEMPCFALTEPRAGSDAGAISATGVLFKGNDGKLKIKLNWNKRWITLAAIATVQGLAFRLRDPENLLGKGENVGITCALVPSNTPGVKLGRRHDPLGVPFYNCPTLGEDVVVDAEDAIIGGLEGAGKGWGMLMECLAAGRGISLPSQTTGSGKAVLRVVSAHAAIRKQFGLPIGKFEGVEEAMARMVGLYYAISSLRLLTLGGLDKGIKAPVVTAIGKYFSTELGRRALTDGMDIIGGAGISRGPHNIIANIWISGPIGITVEGANILTRTLMIFGQGALRAHPYAYAEVRAAEKGDLSGFDRAFWGHMGHIVRNAFRSVILSLTRGKFYLAPVSGPTAKYYRKLAWASASFAILADITMGGLGGSLKVKEKITGRFADIFSYMYICFAMLKRWEADGRRQDDLVVLHWAMKYCLVEIQNAFDGILANLNFPGPMKLVSLFLNYPIRMWSRMNTLAHQVYDVDGADVSRLILGNVEFRENMTNNIYTPNDKNDVIGRLDHAYKLAKQAEPLERKIKKAIKRKELPKKKLYDLLEIAKEKQIITQEEFLLMQATEDARWMAIQVDSFTEEQYLSDDYKKGGDQGSPENRERPEKNRAPSPLQLIAGK